MSHRILCSTICIVVLLALTCCDDNPTAVRLPTAATAPAATQPAPVSPYGPATTIPLGETSTETIHATDPNCRELSHGGYYYYPVAVPCQRFVVNPPQAGALAVHVEWGNADNMLGVAGRIAPYGKLASLQCCSSPLDQTYQVKAAGPFLIFVSWSGNHSGANLAANAAQDFQITATFTAFANAQLGGVK